MNINPVPPRACALLFTKALNPNAPDAHDKPHFAFIRRIPDHIRNHFIAMCGEFVGTFLFLFFALSGTQVANNVPSSSGQKVSDAGSNPQQLVYISLCFGFSLAVNAWVFFRISGGLFNPAVTFGMCLIGALPLVRGILLFFTQIVGGIVAAALVDCMFPGPLSVRTVLGGGASVTQGLFIEMFLTAQLVFTIFMLAAEKHKGTFIAPVGIGLALFIAELSGVYFTGGSLNPARSFGPTVVSRAFAPYDWIYWLGPFLGSLIAAGFYKFIKILEYETANPGQDMDHPTETEHDMEQKIEEKKRLLIAAGINEHDAHQIATELTQNTVVVPIASSDADTVTSSQGSPRQVSNSFPATHGTQYSPGSTWKEKRGSQSSDATLVRPPLSIARPVTEQPGRFSHLGGRGAIPRSRAQGAAFRPETALHSPRMATYEELYAPFETGPDIVLGDAVRDRRPAHRLKRTSSNLA